MRQFLSSAVRMWRFGIWGWCTLLLGLHGCSSRQQDALSAEAPTRAALSTANDTRFEQDHRPAISMQNDACQLLAAYPHWKTALREGRENWKLEPWFVLAFIYQESRFEPRALSKSLAYGFPQAKDATWDWYMQKTGHHAARRERFDDAVDFMGFYVAKNSERNGVAVNDVKNQYLAYHEGMGGFARGSYIGKPWLLTVSDKVAGRAQMYQNQLQKCPL